jgi:DNA (cytosine-5)-methyltransferase 1
VYRFYDFFAGAGLATLGLSPDWECVWANDIDHRKESVYAANFGPDHYVCDDIANLRATDLPRPANLAWASFPCQDLSLAGWRRGLSASRSGTFWAFWRILHDLLGRGERPPIVVIENVAGLLYGDAFAGLCEALAGLETQFGAMVLDAKHFVPQSRTRVFLVCVDSRVDYSQFRADTPIARWTPQSLEAALDRLDGGLRDLWRWWHLPVPEAKRPHLSRIVERKPTGVQWHSEEETQYLISLMSDTNRAKVEEAAQTGKRHVGFLYRRMRNGHQRAEVRFDGVSGCLRTPRGGSSRQTVVVVDKGTIRSRLLSPREAARLMGAEDTFLLPDRYNDAYKAMGDGVVVPVVRWLSQQLLLPIAEHAEMSLHLEQPVREQHHFRQSNEQRATEWLTSMKSKSVRSAR